MALPLIGSPSPCLLRFLVGCILLGTLAGAEAQILTPGSALSGGSRTTGSASLLAANAMASLPTALPEPFDPAAASNSATPSLPRVFAPSQPRTSYTRYPWKRNIVATVFWIGEKPSSRNPTPNNKSSWDKDWESNFGGYDDPDDSSRLGFRPKKFVPRQNPFYIALPYNDIQPGTYNTKSSARESVPWFKKDFQRSGQTILKGRWIAIRRGSKVCYAQWEDCGPFETDDWEYVFGDKRPSNKNNEGAGLDVSPAIKSYLGFSTNATCDWRFVDTEEVPEGPWRDYGDNNPFVRAKSMAPSADAPAERIVKLRELRDEYLRNMPLAR